MGFLSPLFLLGALAASVPIVLHLLKRDPENRVPFPAVHLLKHAPVEHSSRRRLRELLLLALRVTALLLLAFAFARPFFASGLATSGATTVVALDTSLSLSAPGQFEKARQLAREALASAPAGNLTALVTFADSAQVASQPSADRAVASAAVDRAQAGAGATRYRAALNAGVDLLRGRPGRIVVVTDLQETGWDVGDQATVPEGVTVEVRDVGAPPPNLAVTAAQIAGDRLLASVRNAGTATASVRVLLSVQEGTDPGAPARVAGETTVPVAAGQVAGVAFPLPKGRWASVSVDDPAGAAGDNARFVVLDTTSRPSVLVIATAGDLGREAFYLEQALLAAGADGRAYAVEAAAAGELAGWDQPRLDRHTAVVLVSTRALEHHGRELLRDYLARGGGMIVAAGPDVDGDVLQEVLGGPRLSVVSPGAAVPGARVARTWAPSDVRHPVIRAFGSAQGALGLVQFQRVSILRTEDCPVLARFTTGEAALVDCASGEGHALVLSSDLDNRGNDFPLHATFVPFLHEAVRYLTGGEQRSAEYLVADVPAGVPAVPGVAALKAGRASNLVAVNVDPVETDPGRLTPEEFSAAVTTLGSGAQAGARLQAQETEERQHIWQYVLAVMLVLLIVETGLAARTA
ncbi:MAG: BatA domain-containing protein [Vicinamibacterales bacterium]